MSWTPVKPGTKVEMASPDQQVEDALLGTLASVSAALTQAATTTGQGAKVSDFAELHKHM